MQKAITAIIVDDEVGCRGNLNYYLSTYCPNIKVVGAAGNLSEAEALIKNIVFDIAFMDIELLNENSFELLLSIPKHPFRVVFVTAHEKYAVKAFKVEALDYLLKPLSQADILVAYQKIQNYFDFGRSDNINQSALAGSTAKKVILKHRDRLYVIKNDDIVYLQAKGLYTKVVFLYHAERKMVLVSKLLSSLSEEYQNDHFFRIHKSFIVNTKKIAHIIKESTLSIKMQTGDHIPVAKRRSNDFITFLHEAH